MYYFIFIFFAALCLPTSVSAADAPASFSVARSLLAASSSPGNAYVAGASVVLTAPVSGDFSAFGGSIITAAPIAGDNTLIAGSVNSRARVSGDLRAIGGSISVEEAVLGDLVAFGLSVKDSGRVSGSTFIIAANTTIEHGAVGPVTVYGNNIALAGEFKGDVTLVASGRVSLASDTLIRGKLSYEAPDTATIPESATILGGVSYTNASYLPDVGTSRILALISLGFFLFVRILGALILAGLLAGLFPRLAEAVSNHAHVNNLRTSALTLFLGFAVLVASPVLIVLLALTFVGIGLSMVLFLLYALLATLSLLYAGIVIGAICARRFMRRETVLWHDGVLGMLILSLAALVPVVGPLVVFLLTVFSAGTLLMLFFTFAFPHESRTSEMV